MSLFLLTQPGGTDFFNVINYHRGVIHFKKENWEYSLIVSHSSPERLTKVGVNWILRAVRRLYQHDMGEISI